MSPLLLLNANHGNSNRADLLSNHFQCADETRQ
jgi:hypothetical protein